MASASKTGTGPTVGGGETFRKTHPFHTSSRIRPSRCLLYIHFPYIRLFFFHFCPSIPPFFLFETKVSPRVPVPPHTHTLSTHTSRTNSPPSTNHVIYGIPILIFPPLLIPMGSLANCQVLPTRSGVPNRRVVLNGAWWGRRRGGISLSSHCPPRLPSHT